MKDRCLEGLLLATVVAPALAFAWGRDEGGHITFVLYREPKLIAISILGWLFLVAFTLRRFSGPDGSVRETGHPEILRRPALLALAVFVGYLALTGLWVRVAQNYFYELNQYILLFALLVALLVWSVNRPQVAELVRGGLVASLAMVTVVGGLQTVVSLPLLSPINPELGSVHPSFLGYKNPAALAILGQIFLLAGLVFDRGQQAARRWGWSLLLVAELVYLASLRSRTSYMALVVAFLFLLILYFSRQGFTLGARPSRILAWTALASVLAMTWISLHGPTRERMLSLASYIADPGAYLESDRGTYLRNTLVMARHHPLGVGLGDWQTHYPVFRTYNREVSFTDHHQVRRAHSDHVQFLGEGGWPGLFLWVIFLGVLIVSTAQHYRRTGKTHSLFVAAQLVALAAAMATDYLVEMPYGKLQFFLIIFLALAWTPSPSASGSPSPSNSPSLPNSPPPPNSLIGLKLAFLLVAGVQLLYHVELARKVHAAAALQQAYFQGLEKPELRPEVLEKGRAFADRLGHTKSFHKDYLVLGHGAHLLRQDAVALAAVRKGLSLHPFSTHAFRLMATLSSDADQAVLWNEAYQHVMNEATRGFEWVYPGQMNRP